MTRYIGFELVGVVCFILLLIISRILGNSVLTNPQLETVMIALFMINAFFILIIIPAMILLHVRDKVVPGISYGKNEVKRSRKYNIGLIIFFVLDYILSFLVVASKNELAITFFSVFNLLAILFFIYKHNKGKSLG